MTQQAWTHPFSRDDTLSILTNESMPRRACSDGDNVNVVVAQTDSRTEDDRIVVTCFRAAKKARLADPFPIASNLRGWSRKRWSEAREHYELRFGTLG